MIILEMYLLSMIMEFQMTEYNYLLVYILLQIKMPNVSPLAL